MPSPSAYTSHASRAPSGVAVQRSVAASPVANVARVRGCLIDARREREPPWVARRASPSPASALTDGFVSVEPAPRTGGR